MSKEKQGVIPKDIQHTGPDRLEEILRGYMTLEDTVKEVVTGAKQKKRDTYKWNTLQLVVNWHGLKPADRVMVGTIEEELKNMTEEQLEQRLEQLRSEAGGVPSVKGEGKT